MFILIFLKNEFNFEKNNKVKYTIQYVAGGDTRDVTIKVGQ